jgi:hypothetical protein
VKRTLSLVVMMVALAGCGSDSGGNSPTLSTPPPPVSLPLNGPYDLVIVPAAACALPATPYVLQVDVTSFATSAGTELRATLPGGGDALTLDMLYPMTGRLQGALSTRSEVPLTTTTWVRLRDTGSGTVSLSGTGRAELLDGTMAGEVTFFTEFSALTCTSADHSWSLVAR